VPVEVSVKVTTCPVTGDPGLNLKLALGAAVLALTISLEN
jgi:hypothetical protein